MLRLRDRCPTFSNQYLYFSDLAYHLIAKSFLDAVVGKPLMRLTMLPQFLTCFLNYNDELAYFEKAKAIKIFKNCDNRKASVHAEIEE